MRFLNKKHIEFISSRSVFLLLIRGSCGWSLCRSSSCCCCGRRQFDGNLSTGFGAVWFGRGTTRWTARSLFLITSARRSRMRGSARGR